MESFIQALINILIFVVFPALLVIWVITAKKLKFLVKREDTGKLVQIEVEEQNQVFNLLEMSRSLLKFDESAILCMHQEGEDDDVSETADLNEIANPKIIWIVKDKRIKKDMEDKSAPDTTKRSASKHSDRNGSQPTKQEKPAIKLEKRGTKRGEGMATAMGAFYREEYVVLLGDVGSGKSTVVEKLTGEKGRRSDGSISYTRTSEVFWVPGSNLIICNTPSSNTINDKLEQNVWIAAALNFRPVSRVFIVVKAEVRIDSVIDNVSKYANRFLEFGIDVLGVLVTHMDMVVWAEEELTSAIEGELGIVTIVFSSITIQAETLLNNILDTCTSACNLRVDNENFFKFFKLHSNNRKILRCTNDEIKKFTEMKKEFDEARKGFSGKELVDLVFEFQAYMVDEIVQAQIRLCEKNNFTFFGDGAANEAGHVANMVNQLRMVLYDIRVECAGYQSEHGVSELRRCPYCGLIWTRVNECDGSTTCGNRPSSVNDIRDSTFSVLATFTFQWVGNKLNITKSGYKNVRSTMISSSEFAGCGRQITWSQMATVAVPPELNEPVNISTNDIKMLPSAASAFQKELSSLLEKAEEAMKVSNE